MSDVGAIAAAPSRAARLTRALAVTTTLTLIALGLAWELWLAPLRPGGSWWALKVLPLAAALPGLARFRMHTYRWLTLLVWLYFGRVSRAVFYLMIIIILLPMPMCRLKS